MFEKKDQHPALGKPDRKKPPRHYAIIDQKGCTGCHACIPVCPVDCIETVPGEVHPDFMRVVEIDLERCIGCEMCANICPWETIFMIPPDKVEDTAKEWTLRTVLYKGIGENPEPTTAAATSEEPQDK